MKSFLLSDNIHINEKNFKSMLVYCRERGVQFVVPDIKNMPPIDSFGKYDEARKDIIVWAEKLKKMAQADLFALELHGINLFEVSRAELLSYLAVDSRWLGDHYGENLEATFDKAFAHSYHHLILNMAVAGIWVDFWFRKTRSVPRLRYVGVFSGSLIYSRALLEVMKFTPGRLFVFESFFTGMHFYCEEKYDVIANKSDIRFDTVYKSLPLPKNQFEFEIKAQNCLSQVQKNKNKNVVQPPSANEKFFTNKKSTVLILGQVLNDFSMLEAGVTGLSSLKIYKDLIDKLLANTDLNIIFKGHPWEHKKHNLHTSVTLNWLKDRCLEGPRVKYVDSVSIEDLFKSVDCVVCINSQSGIEAAAHGFKPIQLGDAFWGRRGFSHDLHTSQIDAAVSIANDETKYRLRSQEYNLLKEWLVRTMESWLVNESLTESELRLSEIFHDLPVDKMTSSEGGKTSPILSSSTLESGYRFKRKLKKLFRDPARFFRDAKMFRFIMLMKGGVSEQK